MLRFVWVSLAIVGAAVVAAVGVNAAPPQDVTGPGLVGEAFAADRTPYVQLRGTMTFTADCHPEGISTISYHASGPATGPYPGTFEESGTVTLGPQTVVPAQYTGFAKGNVLDFHATFSIDSALGQVSGRKDSAFPGFDASQECATVSAAATNYPNICRFPFPGSTPQDVTLLQAYAGTAYAATITAPGGSYSDSGLATVSLSDAEQTCLTAAGVTTAHAADFREQFLLRTTPGHANGGGRVGEANFAFEAKSDRGGVKATCDVRDAAGARFRCIDAGVYVQSPNHASISGRGELDGAPCAYRITVVDGDGSGVTDSFALQTTCGFSVAGPVTDGNVVVHDQ